MIQRGSNAPVMFAETTQASDDPMHEINLGDTGQIKLATEQVGVALGPQESPLDFTFPLASLVSLFEASASVHNPIALSSTPNTPSHDPGFRQNAKLPGRQPWTKDDPTPWPDNVPKLISKSAIIVDDPNLDCPSTPVVAPARDTLEGLPILVHNVPTCGSKTRVESSMKMTLDLVTTSNDMSTYERVGSYTWLALPDGTTSTRMDADQMMRASSDDALHLSVVAQYSSEPFDPVTVCETCQERERRNMKRDSSRARKVTPTANKGKSRCDDCPRDATSPVVFPGKPLRDFSNGRICLQARVTCYSRHHKQKEGFRLTFTMADSRGRVVGRGCTPLILVVDDRPSRKNVATPVPRKKRALNLVADNDHPDGFAEPPRKRHPRAAATSAVAEPSPLAHSTPRALSPTEANNRAVSELQPRPIHRSMDLPRTLPGDTVADGTQGAPPVSHQGHDPGTMTLVDSDTLAPQLQLSHSLPLVESIAPSSGTILGGTWVNVIGTNFRSTDTILFGGIPAKTIYRSQTAMRCLSPASATPGSVPISVWGTPLLVGGGMGDTQIQMFTYEDVVQHELHSVALRYLGHAMGLNDQSPTAVARTIIGNPDYLSSGARLGSGIHDSPFQHWAVGLEQGVIGVLKLAHRHQSTSTGRLAFPTSPTGRSLLHLAASLGFHTLVRELIEHGAGVDQRDGNGYTALYYSTLYGRVLCSQLLVLAGADNNLVRSWDRAAQTDAFQTRHDDTNEANARGKQSDCPRTSDPATLHSDSCLHIDVSRVSIAAHQVNFYDPSPARAMSPDSFIRPRSVEVGADADASTAEKKPEPPNCTETSPGKHVVIKQMSSAPILHGQISQQNCPADTSGGTKAYERLPAPASRLGCLTCRLRKKACPRNVDENESCIRCRQLNIECLGYYGQRIPPALKDKERRQACIAAIKQHTRKVASRRGPKLSLNQFLVVSDAQAHSDGAPALARPQQFQNTLQQQVTTAPGQSLPRSPSLPRPAFRRIGAGSPPCAPLRSDNTPYAHFSGSSELIVGAPST